MRTKGFFETMFMTVVAFILVAVVLYSIYADIFSVGAIEKRKECKEAKYTVVCSTRRGETPYSTNSYELHDGACTFTAIETGEKITASNFKITEK